MIGFFYQICEADGRPLDRRKLTRPNRKMLRTQMVGPIFDRKAVYLTYRDIIGRPIKLRRLDIEPITRLDMPKATAYRWWEEDYETRLRHEADALNRNKKSWEK